MTDPLGDPRPPLSEEYLRAALARAEQATPGPWEVYRDETYSDGSPPTHRRYPGVEGRDETVVVWGDEGDDAGVRGESEETANANAAFIAAARQDVPNLARECLRLRGLLAEAAGALKLVRAFGSHGESVDGLSVSYFVEKAVAAVESDTELADAVAARVRAHLNPTETHPDA